MGSLPLAKAGVGSAMNDTTRQVGGALGVAILGSIFASSYAAHLAGSLVGLPTATVAAATNSVGSAIALGTTIGGSQGAAITAAAKSSFITAMDHGLVVAALIALLGAVVAIVWLPNRVVDAAPRATRPTAFEGRARHGDGAVPVEDHRPTGPGPHARRVARATPRWIARSSRLRSISWQRTGSADSRSRPSQLAPRWGRQRCIGAGRRRSRSWSTRSPTSRRRHLGVVPDDMPTRDALVRTLSEFVRSHGSGQGTRSSPARWRDVEGPGAGRGRADRARQGASSVTSSASSSAGSRAARSGATSTPRCGRPPRRPDRAAPADHRPSGHPTARQRGRDAAPRRRGALTPIITSNTTGAPGRRSHPRWRCAASGTGRGRSRNTGA